MKTKEFNLSKRIILCNKNMKQAVFQFKDVKEFIRKIKLTTGIGKQWEKQVDKLAGDKLK